MEYEVGTTLLVTMGDDAYLSSVVDVTPEHVHLHFFCNDEVLPFDRAFFGHRVHVVEPAAHCVDALRVGEDGSLTAKAGGVEYSIAKEYVASYFASRGMDAWFARLCDRLLDADADGYVPVPGAALCALQDKVEDFDVYRATRASRLALARTLGDPVLLGDLVFGVHDAEALEVEWLSSVLV